MSRTALLNLKMLYNPFYGSEKLNPEEGETKEIGINTRIDDKTTFSAHYFRTDSDNLIGFNNVTWKYYNAGAETIKGWDVQLTKAFMITLVLLLLIHIPIFLQIPPLLILTAMATSLKVNMI